MVKKTNHAVAEGVTSPSVLLPRLGTITAGYQALEQQNDQPTTTAAPAPNKDHRFPERLHYMLGEMEKDGLAWIISWHPHGKSFAVKDRKAFEEESLPMWFRQKKFASFQRQLNIYGFTRISKGTQAYEEWSYVESSYLESYETDNLAGASNFTGTEKGGYYHPMFLRGKRFLAEQIVRRPLKGKNKGENQLVTQPDSSQNPDWRSVSPMPPSPSNSSMDPDSAREKQVSLAKATPPAAIPTNLSYYQIMSQYQLQQTLPSLPLRHSPSSYSAWNTFQEQAPPSAPQAKTAGTTPMPHFAHAPTYVVPPMSRIQELREVCLRNNTSNYTGVPGTSAPNPPLSPPYPPKTLSNSTTATIALQARRRSQQGTRQEQLASFLFDT